MKLRSLLAIGLVLVVGLIAALVCWPRPDAQKEAKAARRTLRQQGFKTDLSDFNFLTDYETAARVGALTNIPYTRPTVLLRPCGTECAVVAWKQAAGLEEETGYQNLPPLEQLLASNQASLNAACAAALGGPIRFPLTANHGNAMLLVHLASLNNLAQALGARVVVELRENRHDAAWTNLLALTRLATVWEPEPTDISHLVRFNLARTAWKAAWQALQAHSWTEKQLVALQREWEAPDFFKSLPETAAFARACAVDTCLRERTTPRHGIPLKSTLENAVRSPSSLPADAKHRWQRSRYRVTGTYEDERDLLLFYRDRELEMREAITAPAWLQMRALPGVTNRVPFLSNHSSSMQALLNTRQLALAVQLEGKSLLGRAAETEARRRLVIAAIALERYRVAHGPYPKELPSLVPAVLKSVPVDFIDGEPLRYRLCAGSEFVLYSTGLDCVDDGGEFNTSRETPGVYPRREPADGPDLIWPRAATDAEMQAFQLARARAEQERQATAEREAAEFEKEAEERRQEVIAELAGIYARGETPKLADPRIEGALLSEVLRNQALGGPPLRLEQMLTLRQITTGEEPDIVTFELPLSYEVVTKLGSLRLLCDADPTEEFSNEGAELQECVRATNGNCRLVWNTTYDPPGRHFLQAQLSIERGLGRSRRRGAGAEETTLKGPLFSFVSTNVLQFFPMADVYSEKGAYFRVRLAQPIGSYSLELTTPSGEHIHTITGSTTNGIVELQWDLMYDGGKRYTNDSFNSTWTVTFPDPPMPAGTNVP